MNPEVHRLAEECRCLLMEVREVNRGIAEAKVREAVVRPNVDKLLEEGKVLIAAGRDVEGYAKIDDANALLGPASKWPDNWRKITVRVMAQSDIVSKELKWWAEGFEAKTIAEKGEQAEAQRILKALQRCLYNEMEGRPLTYLVDLQILPWVAHLEEQAVPYGEEKAQAKEEPRPEEQEEPTQEDNKIPPETVKAWEDAARGETKGRRKKLLTALGVAQGRTSKDIGQELSISGVANVAKYKREGFELGQDLNLPDLSEYIPEHRIQPRTTPPCTK